MFWVRTSDPTDIGEFTIWHTKVIFTRYCIDSYILENSPSEWDTNESYQRKKSILGKIKVTNDVAKRGFMLIEEYNKKLLLSYFIIYIFYFEESQYLFIRL